MSLAYYHDRSDKAQRDMLTRLQDEIASLHEERRELIKRLSMAEFRARNRQRVVRQYVDNVNDGIARPSKDCTLFQMLERDANRWLAWDEQDFGREP